MGRIGGRCITTGRLVPPRRAANGTETQGHRPSADVAQGRRRSRRSGGLALAAGRGRRISCDIRPPLEQVVGQLRRRHGLIWQRSPVAPRSGAQWQARAPGAALTFSKPRSGGGDIACRLSSTSTASLQMASLSSRSCFCSSARASPCSPPPRELRSGELAIGGFDPAAEPLTTTQIRLQGEVREPAALATPLPCARPPRPRLAYFSPNGPPPLLLEWLAAVQWAQCLRRPSVPDEHTGLGTCKALSPQWSCQRLCSHVTGAREGAARLNIHRRHEARPQQPPYQPSVETR